MKLSVKTLSLLTLIAFALLIPQGLNAKSKKISSKTMDAGQAIYTKSCAMCHQANGQGLAGIFPPLAKSDYLMKDKKRSIVALINGLQGEIKVNDVTYNGVMPAQTLKDKEIAQVMTYIRNSWGNKGSAVSTKEVKKVRKALKK